MIHDPRHVFPNRPTPCADISSNVLLAGGNSSLDPKLVAQGCPRLEVLLWMMLYTRLSFDGTPAFRPLCDSIDRS